MWPFKFLAITAIYFSANFLTTLIKLPWESSFWLSSSKPHSRTKTEITEVIIP